jgi:hypothetical protein
MQCCDWEVDFYRSTHQSFPWVASGKKEGRAVCKPAGTEAWRKDVALLEAVSTGACRRGAMEKWMGSDHILQGLIGPGEKFGFSSKCDGKS